MRTVDSLWLDPKNPRLGRAKRSQKLSQPELLSIMSSWTLEELVDSFLKAGGFWTQDALIVVEEEIDGAQRLVVVEGNRRLAALKLMKAAVEDSPTKNKSISDRLVSYEIDIHNSLFTSIPYLIAPSRKSIDSYLGFRHVTGIKEWPPTEKAEFITKLLEEDGLSYRDVAKQIGSRADVVRHNYIAFKILLQIEELFDADEWEEVEAKFSVLFLAVKSNKVRQFLGIDASTDAYSVKDDIIPAGKEEDLRRFIQWVFGSREKSAVVRDSRQIDRFAEILSEPRAVSYLRHNPDPQFEVAYSLTKAAADLVVDPLRQAARHITLALSEISSRAEEVEVRNEAWPVIEGGVRLAQLTKGSNLQRARELLGES